MKTVSKLQKKNETGSAVSIFLQEKERLILECIYNYLVSKEGQDISISIYRHRSRNAIIDLELLENCVEMTKEYLSDLGDFTEFYRFGFVWGTKGDNLNSRSNLEYNSFPTNLEEDLRNQTFISSYQGDFYYEIEGVKIVFKR
jgi:hypothetical protein